LPQRLTVSLLTRRRSATSATVKRSGRLSMETPLTFLAGTCFTSLSCDIFCSSMVCIGAGLNNV